MKTTVLIALVLGMSLGTKAINPEPTNLKSQIERTVDNEEVFESMENHDRALVRISFKFEDNGKIRILDSNFSHESVKDVVIQKLSNLQIDDRLNTDKVYAFEFVFERI